MAQQDVRYYLNGLLLDLRENLLRCVATDGHRLALCEADLPHGIKARKQIIVPRKGVLELQRLLEGGDRSVELEVGRSEEHTSELQSLMRISYAAFCLKGN